MPDLTNIPHDRTVIQIGDRRIEVTVTAAF